VAQLTVAPARVGLNRVIVALQPAYGPRGSTAPRPPHRVSVAVSCGCGGRTIGVRVPLQPGSGGRDAWWGNVELPLDGVWSAQIEVDGRATLGAPTFTVGERGSPGAPPVTIASVADLSGPDALECRSQEVGSLLSIELMNLVGGVDGRKLTQEVLDDGGDPAVARADALRLAGRHPVAFLSPCGQGASAAIRAVGDRIPTIVADPGVPVTPGRDVFRFAPNPYAEGFASGQYVGRVGLPSVSRATPRRVAAVVSPSIPGDQERVAGLRDALRQFGISLQEFPAAGPGLAARLERLMPANRWLGVYLDGPFGPLAGALRQIGPGLVSRVNPTAILTSSRLAGEEFVEASGDLGREGQIRSVSDVDPTTPAAQTYTNLILQLVGELPSLPGLSGFTAGQALAYGLIGGTDPRTIAARLRAPAVFSRAAIGPWSDRDPAAGTLMFRVLLPSFLTQNLIPVTPGMPGEVTDGQFFPDGDWEQGADSVFTPLPIR
jgi:ABC-type branched-subunit amino acid transport system substrate-binding protein